MDYSFNIRKLKDNIARSGIKDNFHILNRVKNILEPYGTLVLSRLPYILLTSGTSHSDYYISDINRQANGLLLKIVDFKLKVKIKPPEVHVYDYDLNVVCKSLRKYNAYKAVDGSMMGLYHDGQWYLSTKRLFHVSLENENTPLHGEILAEILEYQDLRSRLDARNRYIFFVRHPLLHRSTEKIEIYTYSVKGPVSDNIPFPLMREVPRYSEADIRYLAESGLDAEPHKHKYGLILRSKSKGKYANIFVESAIHRFIRETLYQNLHSNQEEALRDAYTKSAYRERIREILPCFGEMFDEIDGRPDCVKEDIIANIFDHKPTKYPNILAMFKFDMVIPSTREALSNILDTYLNGLYIDSRGEPQISREK